MVSRQHFAWVRLVLLACVAGCNATVPALSDAADPPSKDGGIGGGSDAGCGPCRDCPLGEVPCAGACVVTSTDAQHCGGCGLACENGAVCSAGRCAPTCADGFFDCNGGCIDLVSDPRHCGGCFAECAPGRVCSLGECRTECTAPLIECSGACVDPARDVRHCGGCAEACVGGSEGSVECVAGVCERRFEPCGDGLGGEPGCSSTTCAETHRCVPPSPAGWSEPFVLVMGTGSDALGCPPLFDNLLATGLHQGLLAPAVECACSCSSLASCSVAPALYADVACLTQPLEPEGTQVWRAGDCHDGDWSGPQGEPARAVWAELELDTVELGPDEGGEVLCALAASAPSVTWARSAIGCALQRPESDGCGDGTCVPAVNERLCILQPGEHTCPVEFPEAESMHTGVEDGRGCGACSCEFTCPEEVFVYDRAGCEGESRAVNVAQPCSLLGTSTQESPIRSVRVPQPTCTATSTPQGTARGTGAVSVCCEPSLSSAR